MTSTLPPPPELRSQAAALEGLLQTLNAQPEARHFIAIAHENAALRSDNDSLKKENENITRTIHRLHARLDGEADKFKVTDDELKRTVKDAKDLETKLLFAENKLRASEKKAAELDGKMHQQHEAARKELAEKVERLQGLEECFVKLTPVAGSRGTM